MDRQMNGKCVTADVRVEYKDREDTLYLTPVGEIDHHSASFLREKMDAALYEYRAPTAVLVLDQISFMDSAGLGLILGRYSRQKEWGGCLRLEKPSAEILKILRLAGVERMLPIIPADGKKGGKSK